ncbi:hypothetical protein [Pseudooceanicola sp.]|uniref:hypothetical protein n=1 Tax=Pseudooceanicola sp. TaxID=1914328 RepID=UPI004058E46D
MSEAFTAWAGNYFGTEYGTLFIECPGDRKNDAPGTLKAKLPDSRILTLPVEIGCVGDNFTCKGSAHVDDLGLVSLELIGVQAPDGVIRGKWQASGGHSGTFLLHCHGVLGRGSDLIEKPPTSLRVHSKRKVLGPVTVEKSDLERIGKRFQRELPGADVFVTINGGITPRLELSEFEAEEFDFAFADFAQIHASRTESNGSIKILVAELGVVKNFLYAQGSDGAWVAGVLENCSQLFRGNELPSYLRFDRVGVGLNQAILFFMIAFVSTFEELWVRLVYVFGTWFMMLALYWFAMKSIPNVKIVVNPSRATFWERSGARMKASIIGGMGLLVYGVFATKIDEAVAWLVAFI